MISKFKNLTFKLFILVLMCIFMAFSFSCANKIENNNGQIGDAMMKNEEKEKKDDMTAESEDAFVPESIDLSDISGDQYRIALINIDGLNHSIGEPIYVTKEDYLKYKDTRVSLIGDSIAEFSKTALNRCFKHLVQDSVPGREMSKGIEAFDAMKELDRIGDIMILSLGNNAMRGIEIEVLEHVYEGIEGRPLIIPTIVMPYAGQERNRNRDLRNFVETHENCYIADWNKIARMSENFITEDGVHPTGEGSTAYAQLMLKTVIDIKKKKLK